MRTLSVTSLPLYPCSIQAVVSSPAIVYTLLVQVPPDHPILPEDNEMEETLQLPSCMDAIYGYLNRLEPPCTYQYCVDQEDDANQVKL
jgi:hypothetical protein